MALEEAHSNSLQSNPLWPSAAAGPLASNPQTSSRHTGPSDSDSLSRHQQGPSCRGNPQKMLQIVSALSSVAAATCMLQIVSALSSVAAATWMLQIVSALSSVAAATWMPAKLPHGLGQAIILRLDTDKEQEKITFFFLFFSDCQQSIVQRGWLGSVNECSL